MVLSDKDIELLNIIHNSVNAEELIEEAFRLIFEALQSHEAA